MVRHCRNRTRQPCIEEDLGCDVIVILVFILGQVFIQGASGMKLGPSPTSQAPFWDQYFTRGAAWAASSSAQPSGAWPGWLDLHGSLPQSDAACEKGCHLMICVTVRGPPTTFLHPPDAYIAPPQKRRIAPFGMSTTGGTDRTAWRLGWGKGTGNRGAAMMADTRCEARHL